MYCTHCGESLVPSPCTNETRSSELLQDFWQLSSCSQFLLRWSQCHFCVARNAWMMSCSTSLLSNFTHFFPPCTFMALKFSRRDFLLRSEPSRFQIPHSVWINSSDELDCSAGVPPARLPSLCLTHLSIVTQCLAPPVFPSILYSLLGSSSKMSACVDV